MFKYSKYITSFFVLGAIISFVLLIRNESYCISSNINFIYEDIGPQSQHTFDNSISNDKISLIARKKADKAADKTADKMTKTINIKKVKKNVNVYVQEAFDKSVISVQFLTPVKMSVFTRYNKLWLIYDSQVNFIIKTASNYQFNKEIHNNIYHNNEFQDHLITNNIKRILNIQQHDLAQNASFLVCDIDPSKLDTIKVMKNRDMIYIVISDPNPNNALNEANISNKEHNVKLTIATNVLKPKVVLHTNEFIKNAIKYIDPFVGNTMIVFPYYDQTYVKNPYSFIDFNLIPTIQGVVIDQISDELTYSIKDNDVILENKNVLNVSSIELINNKKSESLQDQFTIYPEYVSKNSILGLALSEQLQTNFSSQPNFIEILNNFNSKIDKSSDEQMRANHWANLAMFYLSNTLYKEAKAAILIAYQHNPMLVNNYKTQLLRGIIEFMNSNFTIAHEIIQTIDLTKIKIDEKNEIRFWNDITAITSFDQSTRHYINLTAYDSLVDSKYFLKSLVLKNYLNYKNNFLKDYPKKMILNFGFILASAALNQNLMPDMQKIINVLLQLNLKNYDLNHLKWLMSKFYEKQNDYTLSTKNLQDCIMDLSDQQHYTACKFDKIKTLYAIKDIDDNEYIETLEDLRMIWRGGNMERDILYAMTNYYKEKKSYIDFLRTMNLIKKSYYGIDDLKAISIANEIGEYLVNFFEYHRNQNLSPIKILEVFYEFHEFIPLGKYGDQITLRAANAMIDLDLLDKAEVLLEYQIKHRAYGNKKEQLINLLALAYLYDNKPNETIKIIENTGGYNNKSLTDLLAIERRHIYVEALLKNKNYSKAISILKNDLSQDADDIKAQIYWNEKKWKSFNDYSEPYIYSIRFGDTIVSNQDTKKIFKQGLSYIYLNDKQLLNELYIDFKERLPKSSSYTEMISSMYQMKTLIDQYGLNDVKYSDTLMSKLDTITDK